MYESDSIWTRKGATLSDKSARQEFGLTQQEIFAANLPTGRHSTTGTAVIGPDGLKWRERGNHERKGTRRKL